MNDKPTPGREIFVAVAIAGLSALIVKAIDIAADVVKKRLDIDKKAESDDDEE